jgi:hypothetical protein
VSSSFRPFRVNSSSRPLVPLSLTRARCFVALQSVCCSFVVSSSPDRFRALSVSLSARPAYAISSSVGHPSIRSSCEVPASTQNPSGSESTALCAPFAPVVFSSFRRLTAPSLGCVSRRGVLVHSWSLVLSWLSWSIRRFVALSSLRYQFVSSWLRPLVVSLSVRPLDVVSSFLRTVVLPSRSARCVSPLYARLFALRRFPRRRGILELVCIRRSCPSFDVSYVLAALARLRHRLGQSRGSRRTRLISRISWTSHVLMALDLPCPQASLAIRSRRPPVFAFLGRNGLAILAFSGSRLSYSRNFVSLVLCSFVLHSYAFASLAHSHSCRSRGFCTFWRFLLFLHALRAIDSHVFVEFARSCGSRRSRRSCRSWSSHRFVIFAVSSFSRPFVVLFTEVINVLAGLLFWRLSTFSQASLARSSRFSMEGSYTNSSCFRLSRS